MTTAGRALTKRQRRLAIGAIVVAVAAAAVLFATSRERQATYAVPDPFADEITVTAATQTVPFPAADAEDRDEQLTRIAAGDAQRMWSEVFADAGREYAPATVRTYRDGVSSKCGDVDGSVGPFYCPAEHGIFLDLNFYDQMKQGLGQGADFAWAYVIAHEVAHHVQQQTGVLRRVNQLRTQGPGGAAGDQGPSVRSELQADCYAGVWIHSAYEQGVVGEGDLIAALSAAQAIGDDNLQARKGAAIEPDTFTHGSSDQRKRWLQRGVDTGQPAACDTFALPLV